MEGYERDQYLMEDYEKDHTEGSEAEVQADADAREDKIDKLKKIIQEAWNEGNLYVEAGLDRKDTFGDFLDRAAKTIKDAGYQLFEPGQTYTLNCDHCGKPFDTPVAFPSPQLCPRCSEPKAETIGEVFARARKRPDLIFPPEYYEPKADEGRLLTHEEMMAEIWDLGFELEGVEGRTPTQKERFERIAKAQDVKTASEGQQRVERIFDKMAKSVTPKTDMGVCSKCGTIIFISPKDWHDFKKEEGVK